MKFYTLLFFLSIVHLGWSQVVINEVYPATNQVELTNIGNDVINMIGAQLFDGMQGNMVLDNIIPTECGDFVLTPGEITVFTFNASIDNSSGQLLLTNTVNDPVSFIQWGGVQSLATYAFSSGVWDEPTDFFPAVENANSIQLVEPTDRRSPAGYLQATPTLCDENTACQITDVLLRAMTCEDNGTPDIPTDDYFSFIPFIEGSNIVGNLDLTLDEGTLTPSSVAQECNNCVVESSIGTANGADYALTITANDGDCVMITTFTAPESCSPECSIATHQIVDLSCNDNGTGTNPDDDYLEFLLTVWSFNGSASGYYIVLPNGNELGPFTYINSHPISTQGWWAAGMGNFPLIIEDADDQSCNRTIMITDPGNCSDDCSFASANLFNVSCNDNGTDLDPSDDYLTFMVEVTGDNLGDLYEISSPQIGIFPEVGSTQTITTFSTAPGINDLADIDVNFVSIDFDDCRFSDILVNPGACSNNCQLLIETLDISCNNNGTPADSSDDFYDLQLLITGTNTGATYTATIQPFAAEAQQLSYNMLYTFSTAPGTADDLVGWGFTFFDTAQQCGGITLSGMFEGPCSEECGFTGVDIFNVQCNNNDTDEDPTDDYITFDVEVSGNNLGSEYRILAPDGNLMFTPNVGSTQTISSFATNPGSAHAEENHYSISLEDATIASCTATDILVNPGSCSQSCTLFLDMIEISCNNNDTPSDTSDDFYELNFLVTGINTSNTFTASIPPFETEVQTLTYDNLHSFSTPPGSVGTVEEYAITLVDAEMDCTNLTFSGMFEENCITTATREIVDTEQVQLYPNPVRQELYFNIAPSLQTASPIVVETWNMQGVLLRREQLETPMTNMAFLPAGTYLIVIKSDSWLSRQIIIKS